MPFSSSGSRKTRPSYPQLASKGRAGRLPGAAPLMLPSNPEFSNEQGCSVSGYRLDPSAGTLSAIQTKTTLPEGYSGRNTCSQIQISASGKFLYVPNRGHNSIAGFSVDTSSGRFTAIGQVGTEVVPSAFSLDTEGDFLFAAGSESNRLASYRVNGDTGALTPLETYTNSV